jgi:hypothetical protein
MTMAPATESVMGALPRDKAGVGSAVNDTTRQMGGALGVAIIGSLVSSVYAARVRDLAPTYDLSGPALEASTGSLGGALRVAPSLGAQEQAFVVDVENSFVAAFTSGLRLGALVVVAAAIVACRYLPARAPTPPTTEGIDGTLAMAGE